MIDSIKTSVKGEGQYEEKICIALICMSMLAEIYDELGDGFRYGNGVEQDYAKVVEYYEKGMGYLPVIWGTEMRHIR